MQQLVLRKKGLQSLDFLVKYVRCNPNIVDIDLSENPLPDSELIKFQQHLKNNQSIQRINLDGINDVRQTTRSII